MTLKFSGFQYFFLCFENVKVIICLDHFLLHICQRWVEKESIFFTGLQK